MPVTTDPLTMSQAPSKEYLQGWNDCHKHMAEEIVRQDTQIEQYDLTIRDRYRAALREMSDELSHYPEGDGIFGHLKRILRRALA